MISEKNNKKYLLCLSFVSGMAIMAVEICASRLLAPYFGTSTFVWANIIGVIMIALAIGYYAGGKISDKKPDLKLLLKIIVFACLLLFCIPFAIRPLVELITGNINLWGSATTLIFFGSLLTVIILFIFPIILLGIVSPFIIKLISIDSEKIGNDAGLVFSISTIGSILGTFLPTLVFIPLVGTRKTIIFFSLLLVLTAVFGLLRRKSLIISFFCLSLLLLPPWPSIKAMEGVVFEDESAYQYFQVVDYDNLRLLKVNEGLGVFSMLNLEPGHILTGSYFDFYNVLPYINSQSRAQDILILGLAGGTVSAQLNYFFSSNFDLEIDGVEIDKKIISVAKKYFGLSADNLTIYNLDGRNFLDFTDKKYDAIVVDVYANQLYISFHLTTNEFFNSARNHLKQDGVLAMNVNATGSDSPLLKNITNTMNLNFRNVYIARTAEDSWNYLVLASDKDINFSDLKKNNIDPRLNKIIDRLVGQIERTEYDNKFGSLSDDKAPIEHLTDWMIMNYVFEKI